MRLIRRLKGTKKDSEFDKEQFYTISVGLNRSLIKDENCSGSVILLPRYVYSCFLSKND